MDGLNYEYALRIKVVGGDEHILPLALGDDERGLELAKAYSPGGEFYVDEPETFECYEVIRRAIAGDWEPFNVQ